MCYQRGSSLLLFGILSVCPGAPLALFKFSLKASILTGGCRLFSPFFPCGSWSLCFILRISVEPCILSSLMCSLSLHLRRSPASILEHSPFATLPALVRIKFPLPPSKYQAFLEASPLPCSGSRDLSCSPSALSPLIVRRRKARFFLDHFFWAQDLPSVFSPLSFFLPLSPYFCPTDQIPFCSSPSLQLDFPSLRSYHVSPPLTHLVFPSPSQSIPPHVSNLRSQFFPRVAFFPPKPAPSPILMVQVLVSRPIGLFRLSVVRAVTSPSELPPRDFFHAASSLFIPPLRTRQTFFTTPPFHKRSQTPLLCLPPPPLSSHPRRSPKLISFLENSWQFFFPEPPHGLTSPLSPTLRASHSIFLFPSCAPEGPFCDSSLSLLSIREHFSQLLPPRHIRSSDFPPPRRRLPLPAFPTPVSRVIIKAPFFHIFDTE